MKYFILLFCFLMQSGFAADALRSEADKLWQKRDDKASLEQALAKYEQLSKQNPSDLEILVLLSRGHFLLGEFHHTDKESKLKEFQKGRSFGEMAMETNHEYKKLIEKKKSVDEALHVLTLKEVPAIYWSAVNLGKWSKSNGVFSSLSYKNQILEMIKKVEELSPDYFYGAVPRYWAGFYAIAPGIAGGDMNKSKKKFEEALKVAPGYLGTKVLMAEVYWTKKDDRKEFRKNLEEVLKSNDSIKELAPENNLEKKKAEKLLKEEDELF
ncbi:MAG: TRAP transporter TatT component family protein [Bacteriovoracaceae bacterium]